MFGTILQSAVGSAKVNEMALEGVTAHADAQETIVETDTSKPS